MFTIGFTDPQGVYFPAAVVAVRTANSTTNNNGTHILNIQDRENPTYDVSENNSTYANYTAIYWPTQEAYDNSLVPYILYEYGATSEGMNVFSFDPSESEYDGLDLIQACETNLQNHVLDVS